MRKAVRFIGFVLFSISSLASYAQVDIFNDGNKATIDEGEGMTAPSETERYSWPIISIGGGPTFYTGGLRSPRDLAKFNGTRWAVNAQVEQRFGKYVGAKLNLQYGMTAGEKHTFTQFDNFQSRMIGVDARFCFHFDHILGKKQVVAPYIALGVGYLNFRSKSDLQDADGQAYYLWDDGSLRDQTQSVQTNGNPVELRRDYTYETTTVKSGNTITFPLEAGLRFKMHDFWDLGAGYTHTFMLGKFLDVPYNKKLDSFGYASVTIYWYLGQFN